MRKNRRGFRNFWCLLNSKFLHYFINLGLYAFVFLLKFRNFFMNIVLHCLAFLYILIRGYDNDIDDILSDDQREESGSSDSE